MYSSKNSKGFTLVELLAVIAILGILSLTAFGAYSGVTSRSKERAYQTKIKQIETAAGKWARENNVNKKTIISVNKLVVEGYLTADETDGDGLAKIINPTNNKNIICKTVEITYKNSEENAKYNENEENCSLAEQALNDSKIEVSVFAKGTKSSIFKTDSNTWTNKPLIIVVKSPTYVDHAISIIYDFEGNSIEKIKTDDNYLDLDNDNVHVENLDNVDNYYNAFYLDVDVILDSSLVISYKLDSGETKSRTINVKIDKEEATASVISKSDWVTTKQNFTVKVDDGNGSGGKMFYYGTDSIDTATGESLCEGTKCSYSKSLKVKEIGVYKIWTEDQAGNKSEEPKATISINNVDETVPNCKIEFLVNNLDKADGKNGWYVSDASPKATVSVAGLSGIYSGFVKKNISNFENYSQNGEQKILTLPLQGETSSIGQNYYCFTKTLAGNAGQTANRLIQVDKTRPTVTISQTTDTTWKKSRDVTVKIKDNISGLPASNKIYYSWSTSNTSPGNWQGITISGAALKDNHGDTSELSGTIQGADFSGKYYLWIKDATIEDIAGWTSSGANGQAGDYVTGPYYFDNTPPSVPSVSFTNTEGVYTPGNWSKSNVKTVPSGSTDNGDGTEGVGGVYYEYTTTGKTRNDTNKKATSRQINAEGSSTIKWRACDSLKNCSDYTQNYVVNVDKTKPTCKMKLAGTKGNGSWYTTNVTIGFEETKDNLSGVKSYGVNSVAGDHSITHNTDGTDFQYTGYVEDKAGNVNSCKTKKFKRDATKPSCSTSKSHTWSTSGVNVSISCSDGTSGVATCAGSTSSSSSKSGVKSSKTYTVKDKAGNTASCGVAVAAQRQRADCSGYKTCRNSACGVATCTSSCCGTYQSKCGEYYAGKSYSSCSGTYGSGCYYKDGSINGSVGYYECSCPRYCTYNRTCTSAGCCGYNSCTTRGCGCASFGNWYNVSSCAKDGYTKCRTLYY